MYLVVSRASAPKSHTSILDVSRPVDGSSFASSTATTILPTYVLPPNVNVSVALSFPVYLNVIAVLSVSVFPDTALFSNLPLLSVETAVISAASLYTEPIIVTVALPATLTSSVVLAGT